MALSPMLRGLRGRFWKVSGLALILVMLALPTLALTGDPGADDSAIPADPQSSSSTTPGCSAGLAHSDYMLNWGPGRQRLADKGLTFNFFYITDALGNFDTPRGTDERFSNWQRIRGTVDYDFGKTGSAKGLSFHATGVWQNGVNMGSVIGSIANPSGIVSFHQFRLDSIWLRQKFAHDKVEVTAGFMASQDFYGLQEYGGSFLNEPMDYNFGNMGNVRASYDPETGPGAQLKVSPSKAFYVKTGWFMPSDDSHVPGHEYRPTFLNYRNGDHGATWDTEVGFYSDPDAPTTRKSYPGIIKAGFIYNGSKAGNSTSPIMGPGGFFDYATGLQVDHNYTFYLQANQPVLRVAAGSNRGLDLTFGLNIGAQNKSEVPTEFTAGAIVNGPLPHRGKDSLAFGFVYSKIGSDFNNFQTLLGLPTLNDEKLYELNYKIQVFPWFVLQPAFQHWTDVGGTGNSASLAGFRLVTTF